MPRPVSLIDRELVGEGVHRSGWPWVMSHFVNEPNCPRLDDFVDCTYTYRKIPGQWPVDPWVGIFHHPVHVHSPLVHDKTHELRNLDKVPEFLEAKKTLKLAIGLCEEVAQELRDWLKVPAISIKHPSDTNVPQWEPGTRKIFQCGFFLRDTRAIYRMPRVDGWEYSRSKPCGPKSWMLARDMRLKQRNPTKERHAAVRDIPRMGAQQYDRVMSRGVVLTHLLGAAANNVVVECLARCTPLLVNRMPAVEEYLGPKYPFFYRDLNHAAELIRDERAVLGCHEYMKSLDRRFLDGRKFAEQVSDLC